MGLWDMYVQTGSQQALDVLEKFADWFHDWTDKQIAKNNAEAIYRGEACGLLEIWANLYGLTKKQEYLDLMETLRSTLSQGELQLMHYFKAVQEFNKQIKSNYREAMAISKSARADELQAQAQGKRKIGMMLSRCLGVTEKFYGNPNRAFMNFSNTILSASVRYCLDCIKAYTYVNNDKKSV